MSVGIPDPRIENGGELLDPGRKPVGNIVIDWSNPLTRGLAFFFLNDIDLVSKDFPDINNTSSVAGVKGLTRKCSASQINLEWQRPSIVTSNGVGTGDYSMIFIGNPDDSSGDFRILMAQKRDAAGFPFSQTWLVADSGTSGGYQAGYVSFNAYSESGAGVERTSGVLDGDYHTFAGVRESNDYKLSIDGDAFTVATATAVDILADNYLTIGSRGGETTNAYNKNAVFACAYDRALSQEEVTSLHRNPYQFVIPA